MKNFILILIVLLAVGYFFYSKYNNGTGLTFETNNDTVTLTDKDKKLEFTKTEPFSIGGYVMGAGHSSESLFSLFSGMYIIVSGDTAIELASASSEKMQDRSSFSAEAQKVLQERGCAASYINEHIMNISAIAENAGINERMMEIKQGDIINIKGYKANIKSATIDGSPVNLNLPNTVYVTEVSVNNN